MAEMDFFFSNLSDPAGEAGSGTAMFQNQDTTDVGDPELVQAMDSDPGFSVFQDINMAQLTDSSDSSRRNPGNSGGNSGIALPIAPPDSQPVAPLPSRPTGSMPPNRPTGPSQPNRPTGPMPPNRPTGPSQPSRPTGPMPPSRPTGPSQPSRPTGPTPPARPVPPIAPIPPVRPVPPVAPRPPVRPVPPVAPRPPILVPPVRPLPPNRPAPQPPIFPNLPGGNQDFSETRFLVAATNNFPISLAIDSSVYDTSARFGTSTGYNFLSDGFHTVTVRRANDLRAILFQRSFPFRAGQRSTLVVVDSGQGGMDVIQVSDTGCRNLPAGNGCYRVANMTFEGSAYNVLLQNSGIVFRNITYTSVTPFKQAVRGSYLFNITNVSCCNGFRELPIIAIGVLGSGFTISNPILTVPVEIQAGRNYTTYLIGNNWSNFSLRAITLES